MIDTTWTPRTQREARALGDPTRHRLFRYIAEADEPAAVAELAAFAGVHPNAVRQHLSVLKDAALVAEQAEDRARPGRPRLLYRLHPDVASRNQAEGGYAWLATMLSGAVRDRRGARAAGKEAGLRLAAGLAGSTEPSGRVTDRGEPDTEHRGAVSERADPATALERELVRRGFSPVRTDDGRKIAFTLRQCPFAEVAASIPDVVCRLHLGLAEGLVQGLGDLAVEGLTREDARRAGCVLTVRRAGGRGRD